MNIVFFLNAIEHLSRISRILRQERGNALLVGMDGCGKQSLTRLACRIQLCLLCKFELISVDIAEYKCYQIELTKTYSSSEFREDIKKVYHTAGTIAIIK